MADSLTCVARLETDSRESTRTRTLYGPEIKMVNIRSIDPPEGLVVIGMDEFPYLCYVDETK